MLAKVQTELSQRSNAQGQKYYTGKADGGMGPLTLAAISAFQSDPANGLIASSYLDADTLTKLNLANEPKPAASSSSSSSSSSKKRGIPPPPPRTRYCEFGGTLLLQKHKLEGHIKNKRQPYYGEYLRHLKRTEWEKKWEDKWDKANHR